MTPLEIALVMTRLASLAGLGLIEGRGINVRGDSTVGAPLRHLLQGEIIILQSERLSPRAEQGGG